MLLDVLAMQGISRQIVEVFRHGDGSALSLQGLPLFAPRAAGGDPGLQFVRPPENCASDADWLRDFSGSVPRSPSANGRAAERGGLGGT